MLLFLLVVSKSANFATIILTQANFFNPWHFFAIIHRTLHKEVVQWIVVNQT